MDDFTIRHLTDYIRSACFDDEKDAFFVWVCTLSDDDLEYYTDRAGWPPALAHFRSTRERTTS